MSFSLAVFIMPMCVYYKHITLFASTNNVFAFALTLWLHFISSSSLHLLNLFEQCWKWEPKRHRPPSAWVSEDRLRPLSVDGSVVMCYIVIFKSMCLFLFYVCACFACTPVHAAWRPGEGAGSLGTRAIDPMLWAAMWSSMTQTQSLCQSSKGSKPSLQPLFGIKYMLDDFFLRFCLFYCMDSALLMHPSLSFFWVNLFILTRIPAALCFLHIVWCWSRTALWYALVFPLWFQARQAGRKTLWPGVSDKLGDKGRMDSFLWVGRRGGWLMLLEALVG